MSDRTLPPTAKRLREARKQGNVARSKLTTSAGALSGGLFALLGTAPEFWKEFEDWTRGVLALGTLTSGVALTQAQTLLRQATFPVALGAMAGGTMASLAVTGLPFESTVILPRLDRLDVSQNLKRLFSWKPLGAWAKSFMLGALLLGLAFLSGRECFPQFLEGVQTGAPLDAATLLGGVAQFLRRALGVLLLAGAAEGLWARLRYQKGLMMSRDEVKREHRSSEGDPQHKAHRRAVHRQAAAGGRARGVAQATAVVVNPTHLAVALRYEAGESNAPYVVAKGREEDALRIRVEARTLGIPIIRDVPLARTLIHLSVGDEVPEELYVAAAGVLKLAWQHSKSGGVHP